MAAQAVLAAIMLAVGAQAHADDQPSPGAVRALLDHIESMQFGPTVARWRALRMSRHFDGGAPDWDDPDESAETVMSTSSTAIHDRTVRTVRPKQGGVPIAAERLWANKVRYTLTADSGRTIQIDAEPFQPLWFNNPTQLVIPGTLLDDPSRTSPVLAALRQGQILSTEESHGLSRVTFFLDDAEIDRYSITFERQPRPRIVRIECDQAVSPVDKPFEERVFVHTEVSVDDWLDHENVLIPSSLIRAARLHLIAAVPKEKWPPEAGADGTITSYERWELLAVSAPSIEDMAQHLQGCAPREGDFIVDSRLGLGYRIGDNRVVQGTEHFRLPAGEVIREPLDNSFLTRLQTLTPMWKTVPTVAENSGLSQGWITSIAGASLAAAGLIVLWFVRRRA